MLIYYLSLLDTQEEKDTLETIYHLYRKRMKALSITMLRNEADAEDAVQQAFMRLIKVLTRIEDPHSKSTEAFIVIVQKNVCRDLARKNRSQKTLRLEIADEYQYADKTDVMDGLQVEYIKKRIDELPEIYRDVLMLKVFYELPNDQIANLLDISAAGVRKRLERARSLLQTKLNKER